MRRIKAMLVNAARVTALNSMIDPEDLFTTNKLVESWERGDPTALKEVPRQLAKIGLSMDDVNARAFALKLEQMGVLKEHGVEMIGAKAEAIEKAEDRAKFRAAMDKIGLESARSGVAHTVDEAFAVLERTGLPSIIRPSFTLGGTGGGVAYNKAEFEAIVRSGLDASPTTEVLLEESIIGWKEYELELMRDKNDNVVVICSIENVDPMGVRTGDSITVAPAQTLTDVEYQQMRDAAFACIRRVGVETGGSNVQFAVNPATGELSFGAVNGYAPELLATARTISTSVDLDLAKQRLGRKAKAKKGRKGLFTHHDPISDCHRPWRPDCQKSWRIPQRSVCQARTPEFSGRPLGWRYPFRLRSCRASVHCRGQSRP